MDTAIVVAGISGAVAAASMVMTYRASSKATAVTQDANQIQWVKEVRADAADARAQIREMSRELTQVEGRCNELVAYLRRVLRSIHEQGQTIERLRETVPPDLPPLPERNGRPA